MISVNAPALRRRVLVVDDEHALRSLIAMVLAHHDTHVAASADEALALVRSGERFDVVLCDLSMPGRSGIDLYDDLVALAPEQAAKITFLTGGVTDPTVQRGIEESGRTVVAKPFSATELRATVERIASGSG